MSDLKVFLKVKDTKERKKVSLKLNENYLIIPSVSTTESISKLKRRMQ